MKLKYYLRGLGIGIITTTILLMIAFALHKPAMSDADIIARAKQLGMVMPEDEEPLQDTGTTESTETTEVTEATEVTEVTETAEVTETTEATEIPETETEQIGEQTEENAAETEGTVLAEPYTLVVNRGDVCRVVCENLQANGIVDDAEAFRKFLGQKGFASSISVGSYTIPYGLDYEGIYQILKLGPQ